MIRPTLLLNSVLQHTVDEQTAEALLREVLGQSIEKLKEGLAIKIEEILDPHLSGHPITYNHYLTEKRAEGAGRPTSA